MKYLCQMCQKEIGFRDHFESIGFSMHGPLDGQYCRVCVPKRLRQIEGPRGEIVRRFFLIVAVVLALISIGVCIYLSH